MIRLTHVVGALVALLVWFGSSTARADVRYCCDGVAQTTGAGLVWCGPAENPQDAASQAMYEWQEALTPAEPWSVWDPETNTFSCGPAPLDFDIGGATDPPPDGIDFTPVGNSDDWESPQPGDGSYWPYRCTAETLSDWFPGLTSTLEWKGYARDLAEALNESWLHWSQTHQMIYVYIRPGTHECFVKITKLPPKGGGDPGDWAPVDL